MLRPVTDLCRERTYLHVNIHRVCLTAVRYLLWKLGNANSVEQNRSYCQPVLHVMGGKQQPI